MLDSIVAPPAAGHRRLGTTLVRKARPHSEPMNEPPIQDLDSIDIVGVRAAGGVDLVVVCSGPLDDSVPTQGLIRDKLQNYLNTALHPNFASVYPAAKQGPTRIVLACPHKISATSQSTIGELAAKGSTLGIQITVDSSAV